MKLLEWMGEHPVLTMLILWCVGDVVVRCVEAVVK